ncbi:MAG: sialidase family protein [Bacteroidota bacterium]
MKTSIIIVFCSLISLLNAQLSISNSLTVSDTFGNSHPQIDLTNNGIPLITWTKFSTNSIYISRFQNDQFLSPLKLNPDGLGVQTYNWSGPDLAIENSNVYVVFKAEGYETGKIYLVKSTDNGNTFSDTMRIDHLSEGYAQYPDIAVLNDTIYTTFMQHDAMGMNPQYVLSRSFDGGLTFENPILAGELLGDEACDCCPPEITVNKDFVMIIFRNNASNIRDIKGVVSFDRGTTFTQIAEIDDNQWFLQACPSSGPDSRINSANILHTVFKSSLSSVPGVFMNAFDVNQNSSLATISISEGVNNPNYPQISLNNDTIGVVFEGNGSGVDVYFNHSYSGINGINQSSRINLSNITGAQSKPDIIFRNGTFHVVYADASKLTYVKLSESVGINELKNEKKLESICISKSQNSNLDLKNYMIYSPLGNQIQASEISTLAIGNYFLLDEKKQTIQKLIIIP